MMAEHINSVDTDGTNSNVINVEETQQKSFQDRLQDIPAYTSTLSSLSSWYTALKGTNEYIKSACDMGESLAAAATPVVLAATDAALKAAEPVVGDVKGTVASIDERASDFLAKVEETHPFVKQTPGEIVEAAKATATDTANYYYEKAQSVTQDAKATATDTANYYYEKAQGVTQDAVIKQIDNAMSLSDTANYYYEKVQGFNVSQDTVMKQLDNAVSLSDLVVELCLPVDSSNLEETRESEQDEQDEDKGVLVHAANVKNKVYRRGTKKLMTYKAIATSADMVQYAQNKISETTGMLMQGSTADMAQHAQNKISETTGMLMQGSAADMVQYAQNKISETTGMLMQVSAADMVQHAQNKISETTGILMQGSTADMVEYAQNKISETTELLKQGSNYLTGNSPELTDSEVVNNSTEGKGSIQEKITDGRDLVSENGDAIYKTSMFIPTKNLQVNGEVFVSANEMVFAYSNASSVTEMPHHVIEVAESYYNSIKEDGLAGDITEKSVAFVYVPAQVVSNYMQANRLVQWIVPHHIRTDKIQVMENVNEDTG